MWHITKNVEFPRQLHKIYSKAIGIEWLSFLYSISTALFTFLAMSNSQTMKTVWLEDLLGIIPPASFLVASRIIRWKANHNFPYGYHKITGICFFASSLALFFLGVYLLIDGSHVLLKQEQPIIPVIYLWGHPIWLGYIMIIVLLWSSLPSTILGHIKIPLAKSLYDKILFTDSKMNKASWMSGFASILGILGIAAGYWWADAGMAIVISFSIMKDGFTNLKTAILDLMDEIPKTIEGNKTSPLLDEVHKLIGQETWIASFKTRFRVVGHIFFGEIFIIPKQELVSTEKIQSLRLKIENYNWRLNDITITLIEKEEEQA